MTLRDRLRRWWNPAQWEDDHPIERKQGEKPRKSRLGGFWSNLGKSLGGGNLGTLGGERGIDSERDFKKPR